MKKSIILITIIFLVTIFFSNSMLIADADEKESKVTVTIIQDSSIDSTISTSENEPEKKTSDTHPEKKEKQTKLPQTNDGNNLYYSVLGLIIFLIAIVGIIYNKKRNGEQYNEKN